MKLLKNINISQLEISFIQCAKLYKYTFDIVQGKVCRKVNYSRN